MAGRSRRMGGVPNADAYPTSLPHTDNAVRQMPRSSPPSPNGKHRAARAADPNTATTTAAAASAPAPDAPLPHHRGTRSSAW